MMSIKFFEKDKEFLYLYNVKKYIVMEYLKLDQNFKVEVGIDELEKLGWDFSYYYKDLVNDDEVNIYNYSVEELANFIRNNFNMVITVRDKVVFGAVKLKSSDDLEKVEEIYLPYSKSLNRVVYELNLLIDEGVIEGTDVLYL